MGRAQWAIAVRLDPGTMPTRYRLQVGSSAKDSSSAGEHSYRQTPIALKRPKRCRQLARGRPVDRVTNRGTVDGGGENRAVDLGAKRHLRDRTGPVRRLRASARTRIARAIGS